MYCWVRSSIKCTVFRWREGLGEVRKVKATISFEEWERYNPLALVAMGKQSWWKDKVGQSVEG